LLLEWMDGARQQPQLVALGSVVWSSQRGNLRTMKGVDRNEQCASCQGAGEAPTDYGVVDCPDCGGSGVLPPRTVRVEWRARDIERALGLSFPVEPEHVRWLLAEMRRARAALTEVIALAHDSEDKDAIAMKIRFTANRALGLYDVAPLDADDRQHRAS
jgi:hypothetical protein